MVIINNNLVNLVIKGLLVVFIITIAVPVRFVNYLTALRLKPNVIKALMVTIAFSFTVCAAEAQSFNHFLRKYQVGFEGAFGVKSFHVSSDIAEINNMKVLGEGGSVGLIWGAKAAVMKIRHGYYYSSSAVTQTVDEVRSACILNFYPLYSLNSEAALRPYVMLGVDRNTFKMYGYYGLDNNHEKINYSVTEAPFMGKISTVQGSLGVGVEYRLKGPGYFVSLFGEAKYGKAIANLTSSVLFDQTTLSNQLALNVGVAFGYHE